MTRSLVLALVGLWASGAAAFEKLGVVALADPPAGPDADLAELAHQLRAACRDRIGGVEDVPTMRARLLGQTSNATLSELERAYGGALAVFQNGEFDSALRTLHAIVEDLESLPETEDSYHQWVRAQLRLAHVALTIARDTDADDAFYTLARTEIGIAPDPDQYSPSYRRRFDHIKGRVRALPARRLNVTADGAPGTVFVNGRAMGPTPLALWLPSGKYRIGGQSGDLRVPSLAVDLRAEDRSVVLDFALAESLRVNAGPGLALPQARRGDGVVRAGAWLGVDKVVAVSRVFEGDAAFLLGSIYDVRRGSLLREGSVRMVAGSVPAANLGALAAFLLTGQSSRDVKDRTDPARARIPVASAAPPPATEIPLPPPPPLSPASPPVAAVAPAAERAPPPAPTAAAMPASAPARTTAAPATAAPAAAPAAAAPPAVAPPAATRSASIASAATRAANPASAAAAGAAKPASAAATRAANPASAAATRAANPAPAAATRAANPASAAAGPTRPAASAPASAKGASSSAPPPASKAVAAASAPAPAAAPAATPSLAIPPPRPATTGAGASAGALSPATPAGRGWMRPTAIGSGIAAGLFAALAIQQGLASRSAYSDADAMVGPGGALRPGSDPDHYRSLKGDGDSARRNMYLSASAAAAFGIAAGVLGWKSMAPGPATAGPPALAVRF